MNVAIIPARGGSKRIPRKNVRDFCGKPMIAWSIEAAKASGCFDHIIVSTDDQEIAEVSKQWGAEVPFMRPAELADDYTPTIPVIRHAIQSFEAKLTSKICYVCCVYATSPFLQAHNIVKGYEILTGNSSLDFAFSVTNYSFPIQRALYLDQESGVVRMFNPEHAHTRSQDLKASFHDAGQFYWGRSKAFFNCDNIFLAYSAPILLPRLQVQDIDTPEDWYNAEQLHHLQFNIRP